VTSADFDLVVIGAGSAGRDAANTAARDHGARVAIVENTRWGGSCPNVACKPTKAYLVAADLVRDLRTIGPDLGLPAPPGRIDLALVRAWKDTLRKTQERWLEDLRDSGYETVSGTAALEDTRTVRVGERTLTSDRILIATGSRTAVPPIDGLEDWIDHISALELDELPESMLVVGGGPVGLEFAQAFARFGTRVTIAQTNERISPRSDHDASRVLTEALVEEGIDIVTGTSVSKIEGNRAVLGNGRTVEAERIFLASGRQPNVEDLGLDRIGVETTRAGIVVDEHMRTAADGVWAAGDVTGLHQFTPVAQYQARIAVADMFGEGRAADYSWLPTAIFTDPELASVGLAEADAQTNGIEVGTSVQPISNVTRSQYVRERHGLFKVVYDNATGRVVGVHVVSRNASDVVQGLALGLARGVTVDELATVHHVYPSWGEGVKGAAEQAPRTKRLRAGTGIPRSSR
jgi:mercuric reductase